MPKTMLKTFGVVLGSGFAVACVAGLITWGIMVRDPFAVLGGFVIGTVVGYPIGVIAGIVVVNKFLRYQGSLVLGILGSIIGGVISYFIFYYVVIGSSPIPDIIEWILVFVVTPLLGTLGYCLWRR